jgi:hypothetical protein
MFDFTGEWFSLDYRRPSVVIAQGGSAPYNQAIFEIVNLTLTPQSPPESSRKRGRGMDGAKVPLHY